MISVLVQFAVFSLSLFPRLRSQTEASMSRPSQTESTYVQTVPDGSCLCPDFRAFTRLSVVNVQTFVRSPDFRAFMSRLLCVHPIFVRSTDFCAFMSRLSCVRQTFVRSCSDFRAFFDVYFDYVILNARRPPRAFIFGLDILASVWDLNLGCHFISYDILQSSAQFQSGVENVLRFQL